MEPAAFPSGHQASFLGLPSSPTSVGLCTFLQQQWTGHLEGQELSSVILLGQMTSLLSLQWP